MSTTKSIKIIALLMVFLLILTSCNSGKKFESPESMLSELVGTYKASGEHFGERIVISNACVIKFDVGNIFQRVKYDAFFKDNFSTQDWNTFDINTLLNKPYVKISAERISADIGNSTLSGLWVDNDGTLYSQKDNGYPFKKISSESDYPTDEMKEKFDEYSKYLQEYEKKSIINEAEKIVSEKQKSLDSKLSSANDVSSNECNATAKTIAGCAFDSMLGFLDYPSTAELLNYTEAPQMDPYGRVVTLITIKYQNKFGNYITNELFVVLQSCSRSGEYTYKPDGAHYAARKYDSDKDELLYSILMNLNDWNEDPNADPTKETPYLEAIQIAKDGNYESAIEKLEPLNGYKKSKSVIDACKDYMMAEKYQSAINLFAEKKYSEAAAELSALTSNTDIEYWKEKAERVIYLCDINSNASSSDNELPSDNNTSSSESESKGDASSSTDNKPALTSITSENNNSSTPVPNSDNSTPAESQSTPKPASSQSEPRPVQTQSTTKATTNQTTPKPTSSQSETKPPKTEKPNPCANGHSWVAQTKTVHYDETGHYETVVDAKKVIKYKCALCGYGRDNEYDSIDAYYKHFDAEHSNESFLRDGYEEVERWEEYETEEWVVDSEAYDETVITGYKCSVCGAKE